MPESEHRASPTRSGHSPPTRVGMVGAGRLQRRHRGARPAVGHVEGGGADHAVEDGEDANDGRERRAAPGAGGACPSRRPCKCTSRRWRPDDRAYPASTFPRPSPCSAPWGSRPAPSARPTVHSGVVPVMVSGGETPACRIMSCVRTGAPGWTLLFGVQPATTIAPRTTAPPKRATRADRGNQRFIRSSLSVRRRTKRTLGDESTPPIGGHRIS